MLLAALPGCAPEPELEGAALRAQAQELWRTRCATCHGLAGRGDGPTGRGLDPRPRDFQDAAWQAQADDARLRRVIVEGGAALGLSAEMAANADLERRPAMVGALIEIVRGFAAQPARDTKSPSGAQPGRDTESLRAAQPARDTK